jgi:hypothetical protein
MAKTQEEEYSVRGLVGITEEFHSEGHGEKLEESARKC